jgi:aminoglycoside/choline kinase family phosphotransferase
MRTEHPEAIHTFLDHAGWGDALIAPLPGDASTRRYARLTHGTRTALLMNQPQSAETPPAPTQATPQERRALGYNALARLAGADCARFVAVAEYLRGRGLSAPQILAADPPQGLVLLEDLGDGLYSDVLDNGEDETLLYTTAAAALARLHAENAPETLSDGLPLHAYDETALLAETDLLTEWFFPLALGRAAHDEEIAEHRTLWKEALAPTLTAQPVFVHRDYHAQNLLWLPRRAGIARVGLIDFQDAVRGNKAYDLVSLVEDARRAVSPALAKATIAHYRAAVRANGGSLDGDRFHAELAVMAAQRNAKIAGIFARLFKRDGKPRYLTYLPRVWNYLEHDLHHPALTALEKWYDRKIPHSLRGSVPMESASR